MQAHRLLGDGAAVSHHGHLGQQPGLVHVLADQFLDGRAQAAGVLLHRLGIALFHRVGHLLNAVGAEGEILLHLRALPAAHLHQLINRRVQRLLQQRAQRVLILLRLRHHQHVRQAGDVHQAAVILPAGIGKSAQGGCVCVKQRAIHLNLARVAAHVAVGHEHVHVAPGEPRADQLPRIVLQKHQVAGHAEGQIQEAVIHTLEFDRQLPSVQLPHGAAVTGHT